MINWVKLQIIKNGTAGYVIWDGRLITWGNLILPILNNVHKVTISSHKTQILHNNGTVTVVSDFPAPWKPQKIDSNHLITDIETLYGSAVYLLDNKYLFYESSNKWVELSMNVNKIIGADNGIVLWTSRNNLVYLGDSEIPLVIAKGVKYVNETTDYIFYTLEESVYIIQKDNPTYPHQLLDLEGFLIITEQLALSDGGLVAVWNTNGHVYDYIDFPRRIIYIYSHYDSHFAIDETGDIWVWGSNINDRLGLNDASILFIETPIINKRISRHG
ncbi:hypothetical protein D3C78_19380 [compost metagenome]